MTHAKKAFSRRQKVIALILSAIVLLLAITASVTAVKMKSDVILYGVHAGGVDLSGLTVSEAAAAINTKVTETADKKIEITAGNDVFSATYVDFGASYNCEQTAEDAYAYGHSGFIKSVIPALKSVFGLKTEIELSVIINDRTFDKTMAENTDYDKSVEASFEITEDSVIVTNGTPSYTINPVTAKEKLVSMMKRLDFSSITLEKENIDPIPFDINIILEDYSEEPVSASYARDSLGQIFINPGHDKVTVTESKARAIIKSHTVPGETYSIPAEVTPAEHTTEELSEALFRDTLSSYQTSFATSDANRSTNVTLASKSVNGKILLPGESFSYNDTLGKRTPEAGYKMAGAYANGQSVQQYGGGICQVSSTLYNAVMLANLQIDQRTCHMFKVGYVPLGRDATADYGTVDFVFSNNTEYPIKVSSYVTDSKQIVCEIIGTKTENFSVSFETTDVSAVPFSTKRVDDPTLPEGTEKYSERGSDGARCKVYRIVSVDGEVVSKTLEASSYYMPHNAVLLVGTMKVEEDISDNTSTPSEGETEGAADTQQNTSTDNASAE